MIAIPAVDLRDGACVQLVGGRYEDERIRLPEPRRVAAEWRTAGFAELHLIDLDAATGRGTNGVVLEQILAERGPVVCQVGGGIRSDEAVAEWLDRGAERVIVGTRAINEPAWLERVAGLHPGRIVLAADVREREVVTHGWNEGSGLRIDQLLARIETLPLAGLLVTAVHREGQLAGPDLPLVGELGAGLRHPLQVSGGVRDLADLRLLAAAGAARAVVGMAFYTGVLDRDTASREFGR